MTLEHRGRRLLLVAGTQSSQRWRNLIPDGWDVGITADIGYARMAVQMQMCDLMLLSSDVPHLKDAETVRRLVGGGFPPVVFVTLGNEEVNELVLAATQAGATWLPGDYAERTPELLHAVLTRCARPPQSEAIEMRPREWQERVARLVDLLWQSAPGTTPGPWFTQRYMTERLEEEVARTQRDGMPLAVVVGEVLAVGEKPLHQEQQAQLRDWAATQIGRNKRRCDVTGQYGLEGFMLVLPRADQQQARGACQRIRRVLSHPPQGLPAVRVHFGVAGLPEDRANVPALLSRAEQRLEEARATSEEYVDPYLPGE